MTAMTFAKVMSIVNKVRMHPGFPYKVEVKLETSSFYPSLVVAVTAPDIKNTAETVEVYTLTTLTPYDLRDMTEEILLLHIRDTIHRAIAHEVDEFIEVDGKRVFDPHMDATPKFELLASRQARAIPNELIKWKLAFDEQSDEALGIGSVEMFRKVRFP